MESNISTSSRGKIFILLKFRVTEGSARISSVVVVVLEERFGSSSVVFLRFLIQSTTNSFL
jgi:hypothetical protein